MSLTVFLRSCGLVFLKRVSLFALLNLVFFVSLFVSVVLTQPQPPLPYGKPIGPPQLFSVEWGNLPVIVLNILLFNLLISAFLMVTLSGMVFFLFSAGFVAWRAWLWGALLSQLATSSFLATLPTVILEGEAYALAAVAGIVLGLSWLRPILAFKDERFSRMKAFKEAWRETARLYIAVTVLLFIGALVEAAAITL